MDFAFTPEEEGFRQEFRQWLSEHLVGDFAAHKGVGGSGDETHWEIRLAWERELAGGGWLGITWPIEYGGRGGTIGQELIFVMEHARSRAPYWVSDTGRNLFGPTLLQFGTPAQKARFLPATARGEMIWGQGFSEPDAGSDLASLKTRAVLDGDRWVINGQKIWTTLGCYADWMFVLCRTDPDLPRHQGISMLLVPVDQPAVQVRPIRIMGGGAELAEVFYTDAVTDADMVVGPVNGAWNIIMGTLGHERVMTTMHQQMAYTNEFADAVELVRARGLDADMVVRQRLARIWSKIQVNQYMNYRTFTALLRSQELGPESSVSKLMWSFLHREMGELFVELKGAAGMLVGADYELDRIHRTFLNARAETIYGGAAEVQRNIAGERSLGLPK
jgi:alkylation response protein AidB-like acyl-CoA dehydrogenase